MIQQLIDAGLKLCQIPPGEKSPHGTDWPNKGVTKYDGKSNIGLIHGLNDTCAVDVDHYDYLKIAFSAVGIDLVDLLGKGPRIIGNPERSKVIFRLPEDHGLKKHTLVWPRQTGTAQPEQITVLELRCGNHQDVIHGTHPNGYEYKIIGDLLNIPMIPDDLLQVWQNWDAAKSVLLQACPWHTPPKPQTRPKSGPNLENGESVIDKFNATFFALDLLMEQGYTQHGDRLLSPWSTTKIPAVKMFGDGQHFWNWGGGPFSDGLPHDAFDVFKEFECQGDEKQAVKMAAQLLGIEHNKIEYPSNNAEQTKHGSNIADILLHKSQKENQSIIKEPTQEINHIPPVPLVQSLMSWIHSANGSTPKYAVTAASLSFLSAMFGRRYAFDAMTPINVYLGCHTDSVAQLASMIGKLQRAVSDCGERKILRSDSFSSSAVLKKRLSESPRLYWVTAEYCSALAFSAKQNNSRGYDSSASTIRTIYSGDCLFVDADTYGTKHNSEDIYSPTLTILAFMASGEIHKITKKDEYDRGTLQQLMLIEGGQTIKPDVRITAPKLTPELIEVFKLAKPSGGNLAGVEAAGTEAKFITIQSDVDWDQYAKNYQCLADAYPQWSGVPLGWCKIFKRICGLLAVAQDMLNPVVSAEIADWVNDWVLFHLRAYMNNLTLVGSDSGETDIEQKVQAVCRKFGHMGASIKDIRDNCRQFRRLSVLQRGEIIENMLFDKIIVESGSIKAPKYVDSFWIVKNKKDGLQ